jgi:hypothetical protein
MNPWVATHVEEEAGFLFLTAESLAEDLGLAFASFALLFMEEPRFVSL